MEIIFFYIYIIVFYAFLRYWKMVLFVCLCIKIMFAYLEGKNYIHTFFFFSCLIDVDFVYLFIYLFVFSWYSCSILVLFRSIFKIISTLFIYIYFFIYCFFPPYNHRIHCLLLLFLLFSFIIIFFHFIYFFSR